MEFTDFSELEADPRFSKILSSEPQVRIRGSATKSAQAFLISSLFLQAQKSEVSAAPWLWILPTEEDALKAANDLQFFLSFFLNNSPQKNASTPKIRYLPEWENIPNKSVTPSVRIRLERASLWNQLILQQTELVVSTLPALLQYVYPRDLYKNLQLKLEVGSSSVSREFLISELIRLGYRRTETAEDRGSFSARGDIVDLFQPHDEFPARVEFFDTEIETLRRYDPQTQRTLQDIKALESLRVLPAQEFNLFQEDFVDLRNSIRAWAEDCDISRPDRDLVLDGLREGFSPKFSEFWLPWTNRARVSGIEFISPAYSFVSDSILCQQAFDKWIDGMKSGKSPTPKAEQLYASCPDFQNQHPSSLTRYFDDLNVVQSAEALGEEELGPSPSRGDKPHETHFKIRGLEDFQGTPEARLETLKEKLALWSKSKLNTRIVCSSDARKIRLEHLLEGFHLSASIVRGELSQGFRSQELGFGFIRDADILDSKTKLGKPKRSNVPLTVEKSPENWSEIQALQDLSPRDLVVHVDHGIGRYLGLQKLESMGATQEFVLIEYAGKDKLYLPVYRLESIHRYSGQSDSHQLDKLGSQRFASEKERVKNAVKKIAFDLVSLYATRTTLAGLLMNSADESFEAFEDSFPFEETPDQLRAIHSVYDDLASGKIMDRLICGDVGYGKTEVAIRAAYKAASEGYQVAVLVPTTVLALQHEQSFRNRLQGFAVSVDSVSRFKNAKQQKETIQKIKEQKVDIVIGTHRLLSKDVEFKKLGLLIVDEEHRFGVEHKEKIKNLAKNTHCLTMSATPIPRTLHMALSGIRDISLIHTAPVDRLPIRTFLAKFDDEIIAQAIRNEIARDGQIFFIHNRVETIYEMGRKLQELVPGLTVGIGHGQMPEDQLEEVMLKFYEKKIQVLLCTTIVESGLDVPNANTIIIDRADRFGLAQLYQLRGRVGRGQNRAYAYLLIPPESTLTEDAKKRLEVIQKFVELGSGFQIASHDLEIRGGGDLLGAAQSGHIHAVGFEMYLELLEEAVLEARGKKTSEQSHKEPELKIPVSAYLSEGYVPDTQLRLSFYRRLSSATDESTLESLEKELEDRFGKIPDETRNLLWLLRVKVLLLSKRFDALTVGPEKFTLSGGGAAALDPIKVITLIQSSQGRITLTPESKLIVKHPFTTMQAFYFFLENLLKSL